MAQDDGCSGGGGSGGDKPAPPDAWMWISEPPEDGGEEEEGCSGCGRCTGNRGGLRDPYRFPYPPVDHQNYGCGVQPAPAPTPPERPSAKERASAGELVVDQPRDGFDSLMDMLNELKGEVERLEDENSMLREKNEELREELDESQEERSAPDGWAKASDQDGLFYVDVRNARSFFASGELPMHVVQPARSIEQLVVDEKTFSLVTKLMHAGERVQLELAVKVVPKKDQGGYNEA